MKIIQTKSFTISSDSNNEWYKEKEYCWRNENYETAISELINDYCVNNNITKENLVDIKIEHSSYIDVDDNDLYLNCIILIIYEKELETKGE